MAFLVRSILTPRFCLVSRYSLYTTPSISYSKDEISSYFSRQNKNVFTASTKRPSDSFISICLPLSTEESSREVYVTTTGGMRIGRLLEDLNSLAGEVAYKHSDGFNQDRPLTILTATVDKITLIRDISILNDLKLQGRVVHVGTTSMSVKVEAYTNEGNEWKLVVDATFVMVARDKYEEKSVPVHKVQPTNKEEQDWFDQCLHSRKSKQKDLKMSTEESTHVHDLFLELERYRDAKDNVAAGEHIGSYRTIKSTTNTDPVIMHPQLSSINNKIMAGYITRLAYELAWITAYKYGKERPSFVSLEDNSFTSPIAIGDVVNFTANVVYTQDNFCHVRVSTDVIQPPIDSKKLTNVFHFQFKFETKPEVVVPETYDDVTMYLEGRRNHYD
ncbi:mitochondrial acyl-coenzyme A thioesterase [Acrasis kona]|uniref:Mitochondrial acyl-coenzyme A thioesterase n=1 Tax=Acrasis kona TaxID=1008807 RepID=A0AAW2ZPV5_9EUKA